MSVVAGGVGVSDICDARLLAQAVAVQEFYFIPGVRAIASKEKARLGAAHGNDEHCRAVCRAVPGCNTITRLKADDRLCLLDSACLGEWLEREPQGGSGRVSTADAMLPGTNWSALSLLELRGALVGARLCAGGSFSMFAQRCSHKPVWQVAQDVLSGEETHLENMHGTLSECRERCEQLANCNGFRRDAENTNRPSRRCAPARPPCVSSLPPSRTVSPWLRAPAPCCHAPCAL